MFDNFFGNTRLKSTLRYSALWLGFDELSGCDYSYRLASNDTGTRSRYSAHKHAWEYVERYHQFTVLYTYWING